MTRRREFTTAAARRRAEPIIYTIDEQEIRVRDDLVVTDLADLADRLLEAGKFMPEGVDPENAAEMTDDEKLKMLRGTQALVDSLRDGIAPLIDDDSRPHWMRLARGLSPDDLMAMTYDLIEEVTGKNPTSRSDSSDPSPPAGPSSMVGVLPAPSTPTDSPSIGASTSTSTSD